jgi:hypothetical protein
VRLSFYKNISIRFNNEHIILDIDLIRSQTFVGPIIWIFCSLKTFDIFFGFRSFFSDLSGFDIMVENYRLFQIIMVSDYSTKITVQYKSPKF